MIGGRVEQASRHIGIIGTRTSHDTLRAMLATRPPAKVLDAPTGQGPLAAFLKDLGWDVHCADIDPGLFKLSGVPFAEVNLNRALPYDDESFDVVVCANGLHRLFNPGGAIREFSRILRPGGTLYVNLNNYSSVRARIRFLLYGSMNFVLNEGLVHQTIDDPEAQVRHCLLFAQVARVMRQANLEIVCVQPSPIGIHKWRVAAIAGVVRTLSKFVSRTTAERVSLEHANGPGVLSGADYMVIEAKKVGRH